MPSGVSASAWVSIGGLFGQETPLPRHNLELLFLGAVPLSSSLVLITRVEGALGTRGNANYSFLLGSVNGVRGLPDATYFTWAQLLANSELRQAIRNFRSDRIEDCQPTGLWFKGEGDRLRQIWVDGWETPAVAG